MYCVFNATTMYNADTGNPFGWPLESNYGYFCDQRDKDLYMLSSGLLNMLAIVGLYLVTVLFVGPKLMQNRKAFEIKNSIRLYNFAMILFNCYMIKRALRLVDNGRSFFNCKGVELNLAHTDEIAYLTELFLYSRLADFLDTIWFVLRKKQSHISFLHVFHHSYVPTVAWIFTRWVPVVPNAMSFPFINSAVHVVMYSYYLLATFPSLRQHLWWKRYLTALQMSQFVAVLLYNIFGFFYFGSVCGKSQTTALTGSLMSAIIFLVLFYSFYQRTYIKPAAVAAAAAAREANQLVSAAAMANTNGVNLNKSSKNTPQQTTTTTAEVQNNHKNNNVDKPNSFAQQKSITSPLLSSQTSSLATTTTTTTKRQDAAQLLSSSSSSHFLSSSSPQTTTTTNVQKTRHREVPAAAAASSKKTE